MRKYILVFICFILLLFSYCKYHNMNINDIGLKVLSWVKKIKGEAVNLEQINNANTPTMNHGNWTNLLKKHVTKTGQVNYQGFIQDSILFQKYLNELSQNPTGNNWSKNEQLAYWINAYNAFTVKLIIDHYPLKSIKDIGDGLPMVNSPWDIKFFKIGKTDFDLNTIEHEILRKKFNEPRIHFAINCASVSCPKLKNEAYTAAALNIQLEDQAKQFINNPIKNKISEKELQLSKIFDWFKSDFIKEKTLFDFLQQYTPVKIYNDQKVKFMEYDWNLNE